MRERDKLKMERVIKIQDRKRVNFDTFDNRNFSSHNNAHLRKKAILYNYCRSYDS